MNFLKNQFRSSKNINRGLKAKEIGDLFEKILMASCLQHRISCVRIPNGTRLFKTKSGVVLPKLTKSPFDFIVAKRGLSACIDTKTIDSGNFSYSMIKLHQVISLINLHDELIPSGYLVWFRDIDQMVFFDAKKLYHLKRRESLKPEDGLMLGTKGNFSVEPILSIFKGQL
jgi:penicillin-binding protein-related factor A (putative recombinase)